MTDELSKSGDRPAATDEIEITPAMIEAGVEALSLIDQDRLFFRSDPEIRQEAVSAIYAAMAKSSLRESDRDRSPSERDPRFCGAISVTAPDCQGWPQALRFSLL